ncbi:hypothetical protein ATK17_3724 [Branchiibius hedensis]|nr:hypothetical protein [Branchiibius hedensis]PWJ27521.1 hypothetical protein ATK17_3724 [Branchiibius hedensis]SSA36331.1 hypothetical protein SAMN04489750_3724 [Branchiibius hedensis]
MSAAYALRGSGGAAGPVWTFSTGTPSSGSSSIVLSKSTANNPPTVTTGGNMTGVEPGVTVTLTSTGADIDGDLVTLAWAQTSGTPTVALTDYGNGSASFRAPASVAGATLVFTVTATDGRGGTGTATSTVTVLTADRSGLIGGVRKPRLRTHT